jgi:hypothetical protein
LSNFSIKIHHRFSPSKFDCPCTLKISILTIFVFFLFFVSSRFYCVTIRSKITHSKSIAKIILFPRDLLNKASLIEIERIFGRKNMDHWKKHLLLLGFYHLKLLRCCNIFAIKFDTKLYGKKKLELHNSLILTSKNLKFSQRQAWNLGQCVHGEP